MGDILLSSYIAKNRNGANFTDAELKALKEGNLDNMVSIFVPMKKRQICPAVTVRFKEHEILYGRRCKSFAG